MHPFIEIGPWSIASYHLMVAVGILAAAIVRWRFPPEEPEISEKAASVFLPAVVGLVVGAKLPILMSYGFRGEFLVTGRSLLGALVGAYLAVRLAKKFRGLSWSGGGDAYVLPLCAGVFFGRIGCLLNGCCWGRGGFPAPALEIVFHFAAFFIFLRNRKRWRGNLFPLYLLSYCMFRFAMEFIRCEPRVLGILTVYHIIAVIGAATVSVDLWKRGAFVRN